MEFRTEFADYKDELAFLRAYLTEQFLRSLRAEYRYRLSIFQVL